MVLRTNLITLLGLKAIMKKTETFFRIFAMVMAIIGVLMLALLVFMGKVVKNYHGLN